VGGTARSATNFIVIPPLPAITAFTPSYGPTGTVVTITGSNFNGVNAVAFGGKDAQDFTVISLTSLSAMIGSGTTGTISVTTLGGTASSSGIFTLITIPTITSFSPSNAKAGTVVSLTGLNFTGTTAVAFGGTASASFTLTSSTAITATVGNGATGRITVTNPGGTATSTGVFTFIPAPTITSCNPPNGTYYATIMITGKNFTTPPIVKFNGTIANTISWISSTAITARVPAGAHTGAITVTTEGGTVSSPTNFIVIPPPPSITAFTPNTAGSGMAISITGTNFNGVSAVSIGGIAAASFSVLSLTSLTASIGNGATGPITLTTLGGIATSRDIFTFFPLPTLTSFSPTNAGPGTVVTIIGTNFTGTTAVTLGGKVAASFSVIDPTTIKATVGSGASGKINITTPGGSATSSSIISFFPTPTITSFTPISGAYFTVVTITGTNFTTAPTVKFNGIVATNISWISSTTITAKVPIGALNGPITVTTQGGTATSASIFKLT